MSDEIFKIKIYMYKFAYEFVRGKKWVLHDLI